MSTNCVRCVKKPRVAPTLYCAKCGAEVWEETCQKIEDQYPEVHQFLETWGAHCGAPRAVFRGQLCLLLNVFYRQAKMREVEMALEEMEGD